MQCSCSYTNVLLGCLAEGIDEALMQMRRQQVRVWLVWAWLTLNTDDECQWCQCKWSTGNHHSNGCQLINCTSAIVQSVKLPHPGVCQGVCTVLWLMLCTVHPTIIRTLVHAPVTIPIIQYNGHYKPVVSKWSMLKDSKTIFCYKARHTKLILCIINSWYHGSGWVPFFKSEMKM